MHSSAWVAILRHIPSEQQNQFMLVTASGTEIAIQSFLRIENELVVIKGRLAGSQDSGRVFFIPYCQIDYFGYGHPVKDSDFNDLFGSLQLPDTVVEEAPVVEVEPARAEPAAAAP